MKTVAGYEGIICGASAVYTAMKQIYGEVFAKVDELPEEDLLEELEKELPRKEMIFDN